LAAARALARQAAAPATLRAYRADWTHYAAWCAEKGLTPVPADPATVGAYLTSLADSHAPTTIRRRLAAIGKAHRFNDLPWNPGHRAIQEPLQALLRLHGRPVEKAAALSLAMLRQLVATCDRTARGRRDRALLLIGFAAALRRSELVALQVDDVARVGGRGPRSACRAASTRKPARYWPSMPGRRWPSAAPARCSAASAPAVASPTQHFIRTPCAAFSTIASRRPA
jgi:site-specific recombinase XerD